MAHSVEIVEAYRSYSPPQWVRRTVDRILSRLPPKYLTGLKTIVLTDAAGLNHERRRAKTSARKKKFKIAECRGLYHRKWKGEPAWIELFVDNIVPYCIAWLRFTHDLEIGEVLAHEIGHHIHATKAPEHKEPEGVADKWSARLMGSYFRRRYWYLLPIHVIIRACKWITLLFRRKRKKQRMNRSTN